MRKCCRRVMVESQRIGIGTVIVRQWEMENMRGQTHERQQKNCSDARIKCEKKYIRKVAHRSVLRHWWLIAPVNKMNMTNKNKMEQNLNIICSRRNVNVCICRINIFTGFLLLRFPFFVRLSILCVSVCRSRCTTYVRTSYTVHHLHGNRR